MPAGKEMNVRTTGSSRPTAPMTRAWEQDEAAAFVERLFAKHHGEIHAYLVRMLRDPELAAALTQDAFVKAYRNYTSLENVQGIWTAKVLEMTDLRRNSRTRLTLDKLQYNVPMKDDDFTLQALRR